LSFPALQDPDNRLLQLPAYYACGYSPLSIRKCKLCSVEYLGAAADHGCEQDAWARPIAQPVNATGIKLEGALQDLEKLARERRYGQAS
jgi:hypothetical protein